MEVERQSMSEKMEAERQLTQLHKAIEENKPWIVIATLKAHPELITRGSTSRDGETLLMTVLKKGCPSKYIDKLIEMTPDEGLHRQDSGGNTILHVVAMVGNIELAKLLTVKCPTLPLIRNNSEDLPIHVAVKKGHCLMTDYLLSVVKEQGYIDPFAGVTGQDIMRSAIAAGMDDVIIALSYNNPDLVKSIDVEREEPDMKAADDAKLKLLEAIASGHLRNVRDILEKHPELSTARITTSGETPIMVAAKRECSFYLIEMLIKWTSDVGVAKTDDSDNTVLHTVAMQGRSKVAKLLVGKNLHLLHIRNHDGDLPIFIAIKQRHKEMTDTLFKAGAEKCGDPFAGAKTTVDVMSCAVEAGMYDVADFIYSHHRLPDSDLDRFNVVPSRMHRQDVDDNRHQLDLEVLLMNKHVASFQRYRKAKGQLLKALAYRDDWSVDGLLANESKLMTASVTESGDMPIMVAANSGFSLDFFKTLIGRMSDEELAGTDNSGNTVLHTAAMLGNTQLAKLLLNKSRTLLLIRNNLGDVPICVAIKHSHKEITDFLFKEGKETYNIFDQFAFEANADVMCSAIRAGMYDVARFINTWHPELATVDSSVLKALVEDPSPFRLTNYIKFKAALATTFKSIFAMDLSSNHHVTKMLTEICRNVKGFNVADAERVLKEPFLVAARNGIEPIVSTILDYHPNAIDFLDGEHNSIFHLAVMYRHENIFKLAYQKDFQVSRRLLSEHNKDGNNVLHLAGYAARQNRLDQSTRVILQMQRELKWFKELEILLPPDGSKLKNGQGKTPITLFNEEHKDMVTTEIQWMNGMAQACSVAAPIIATVAFAAAITVPGGNNNSNGLPMFSNYKSFKVFAVSDALALFASIACVLSFLSVFTSRYGVDDFLYALPNRLIIGLLSLFVSATSLMAAFGATLFLIFGYKNALILIPIIAFSCAPVILYAILQLPSLLNMINSTYGRKLLV